MSAKQKILTNKLLIELKNVLGTKSYSEIQSIWQDNLTVLDFINKGLRIVKWKNLPHGIDPRILNINLFFKGKVVFFQHGTYGNFALPMVRCGGINVYGVMKKVRPIGVGDMAHIVNSLELEDDVDCVIFRLNDLEVPPYLYAKYYGDKVSNLYDLIDNNNMWLKFPIIIKSTGNDDLDKKNALVIKEVFSEKGFKFPVVTSAFTGLDIVNVKPQYLGIELFEQIKSWKNAYYEYLGVNHHEEKKERLSTDEVENNQEEAVVNSNKIIEPLQDCVDRANKLFGWNIQVELNVSNTGLYETNVLQLSGTQGGRVKV